MWREGEGAEEPRGADSRSHSGKGASAGVEAPAAPQNLAQSSVLFPLPGCFPKADRPCHTFCPPPREAEMSQMCQHQGGRRGLRPPTGHWSLDRLPRHHLSGLERVQRMCALPVL